MWYPAELVIKNYQPEQLEKGMLFLNILHTNTFKETYEVFSLDKIPRDEEAFIALNGFPIKFLILIDGDENSVKHEQIGWFDFGEKINSLSEISLKEINIILNQFEGWLDIEIEEESYDDYDLVVPLIEQNKVILRFYEEEDDEE